MRTEGAIQIAYRYRLWLPLASETSPFFYGRGSRSDARDVLRNLPLTGGCLSYICEPGHSHQVSFMKQNINFRQIAGIHQEA